ncbi:hypothetical protein [Microbacterium oxydans]|uniref:hypothetical protein n=1 Tax=Microbacterium oxydans TaxID=82380 RepID=UPI0024AE443E|nr:hypothetical protein [Microbacterium oxydans]
MSSTTLPPSDPLTWKQADVDVHVATRGGEFAGFVEFDGSAHLVRDNHGTELGVFDSLEAAFRALEDANRPSRSTPDFPSILPRAWRRRTRRARA